VAESPHRPGAYLPDARAMYVAEQAAVDDAARSHAAGLRGPGRGKVVRIATQSGIDNASVIVAGEGRNFRTHEPRRVHVVEGHGLFDPANISPAQRPA
jgi:hypothetical protein